MGKETLRRDCFTPKNVDNEEQLRRTTAYLDPTERLSACSNMDITAFVVQGRDKALLYGDYSIYHTQLSKKLLNARKKLGIATRNRGKFHKRDGVTAEAIGEHRE